MWANHYAEFPPAFVSRDRMEYVLAVGVASRCKVGERRATVDDIAPWRARDDVPEFEDWMADLDMTAVDHAP